MSNAVGLALMRGAWAAAPPQIQSHAPANTMTGGRGLVGWMQATVAGALNEDVEWKEF